MSSEEMQEFVSDGKNKNEIKCKHCSSKILLIKVGDFVKRKIDLPLAQQKDMKTHTDTEAIENFFQIKDMYSFENIGFSHTVDNIKYLTCADCEIGPVGFHDLNTKESFVALTRVNC